MRDEDEVQKVADKVSSLINNGRLDHLDKTTLITPDGKPYEVERLRGLLDALDWVLDEDMEDIPL
jgi:hypothetical protein